MGVSSNSCQPDPASTFILFTRTIRNEIVFLGRSIAHDHCSIDCRLASRCTTDSRPKKQSKRSSRTEDRTGLVKHTFTPSFTVVSHYLCSFVVVL